MISREGSRQARRARLHSRDNVHDLRADALLVIGRRALEFVGQFITMPAGFIEVWSYMRFIVLALVITVSLVLLYVLAQGRRQPLREVMPGVCGSLAAWMVLSMAFSYYVETMGRYSVLYGSIATVIVVLLWLYMSGQVLILGAEFSAALLDEKRAGGAKEDI